MDWYFLLCNAQGKSPSFDVIWVWSREAVRIFPSEVNKEILAFISMHINTGVLPVFVNPPIFIHFPTCEYLWPTLSSDPWSARATLPVFL